MNLNDILGFGALILLSIAIIIQANHSIKTSR